MLFLIFTTLIGVNSCPITLFGISSCVRFSGMAFYVPPIPAFLPLYKSFSWNSTVPTVYITNRIRQIQGQSWAYASRKPAGFYFCALGSAELSCNKSIWHRETTVSGYLEGPHGRSGPEEKQGI